MGREACCANFMETGECSTRDLLLTEAPKAMCSLYPCTPCAPRTPCASCTPCAPCAPRPPHPNGLLTLLPLGPPPQCLEPPHSAQIYPQRPTALRSTRVTKVPCCYTFPVSGQ